MEVYDSPSHYYPSDAMSLDQLAYWITFNRVSGIGPVSFKSLLEYYDNDLQAAWRADTKELAQAGLTRNTIENVVKLRTTSTPQRELEKLEKLRIRVITWKDKNYPPLLRTRDDMHLDLSTAMEERLSSGSLSHFRFFNDAEEYIRSTSVH